MRGSLGFLALVAIVGFLFTFFLEASFEARAQTVQFIRANPQGLKKGAEGYTELGPPQRVVLDQPGALLPGYGPNGSRLADVDHLRAKAISPLHLESVRLMAWYARVGCLIAALMSLAGIVALNRLQRLDK